MGKCPTCGGYVKDSSVVTFESRAKMPNVAGMAIPQAPTGPPPGFSARRETPTYLPSRETHLDLPLAQAYAFARFVAPIGLVIGSIGGLVAGVVVDLVMAGVRDTNLTGWGYVGIIGLCGVGGAIIAFFWEAKGKFPERLELYDGLLWKAEEVTGRDIDGDGQIGEPEVKRGSKVTIEFTEKGIPREIDDLEVDPNKLLALAYLIIKDKEAFSERTAAKAGMSRDEEWKPFRNKLISRRWAKWKHPSEPKQGVELTPKGAALFRAILDEGKGQNSATVPTHPQPTNGSSSNYERYVPIEER